MNLYTLFKAADISVAGFFWGHACATFGKNTSQTWVGNYFRNVKPIINGSGIPINPLDIMGIGIASTAAIFSATLLLRKLDQPKILLSAVHIATISGVILAALTDSSNDEVQRISLFITLAASSLYAVAHALRRV